MFRKLKTQKLILPIVMLVMFLGMTWAVTHNYAKIAEIEREGNKPTTTIATPLAGRDGTNGEKGDKGDKGDTGATGATGKQGDKGEQGAQGVQGVQGIQGNRGEKGDRGDTGETGAIGASGSNGANGRTPELACVIRWDTTQPTVTRYFVAWKYTDEASTAWRNINRINSEDRLPAGGCVDLRT